MTVYITRRGILIKLVNVDAMLYLGRAKSGVFYIKDVDAPPGESLNFKRTIAWLEPNEIQRIIVKLREMLYEGKT